jgi:hypothetical protein
MGPPGTLPPSQERFIASLASHVASLVDVQHPFLPSVDAEPVNPRRGLFKAIMDYLDLKNPKFSGQCPECAKDPDAPDNVIKLEHLSQHIWRCRNKRPGHWHCPVCSALVQSLERANDEELDKYDADERDTIQRNLDNHRSTCLTRTFKLCKLERPSTTDGGGEQRDQADDDASAGESDDDDNELEALR